MIRRGDLRDLERLREIERAAGAVFRTIGMAAIADDEPPSLEVLRAYQADGRAWVATDPTGDTVAAYLLADIVDGGAHVEQVSVAPEFAHRGLGRALIDTVGRWAAERGLDTVTLTTFADVPWNGPYYARLGFEVVAPKDEGPGLRELRRREREHGLDRWPRQSMRRAV